MTNKDSVKTFSEKYGISETIVEKAFDNLKNGTKFLAVSGKIGAGKDTIAPLILNLYNIQEENRVQESFAYALKKEVQDIIDLLRKIPEISAQEISQRMYILETDAKLMIEWLYETTFDKTLTSYSRTANIRKALQYWGTEVRRNQDSEYWVKKCIQSSYRQISEGKSVYITDVRFPNEADAVLNAFGNVVRIDVSDKVQQQRISSRDGITVSKEAKEHASETSLDEYNDFNTRIDTDLLTPLEVAQNIVKKLS